MTALLLQDREIEDLITEYQPRLLAFIYSLTKDKTQAQDVLQNTNIILWTKRNEFELGSNFRAWAFQIAFYESKQCRRAVFNSKEKYSLSDELIESLQAVSEELDNSYQLKREKLKECLIKLELNQKELIIDRYYGNESVQVMASERGVSPNTMAKQLYRIRKGLMHCVDKHIHETKTKQESQD